MRSQIDVLKCVVPQENWVTLSASASSHFVDFAYERGAGVEEYQACYETNILVDFTAIIGQEVRFSVKYREAAAERFLPET